MKKEEKKNLSSKQNCNCSKKKLQKNFKTCLGLCFVGLGSILSGTFLYLGSMGVGTANWNKAKEKGYEVFNQNYRVEQQTKLYEKFQNGEISKQQYLDKSALLEDFDYKKFMYENATAEELKEFKKVEKVENGFLIAGHVVTWSGATLAVAAVAGAIKLLINADEHGIDLSASKQNSLEKQMDQTRLEYEDYPEICESMTTYVVRTDKGEYVEVDSSSGTKKKIDEKTL